MTTTLPLFPLGTVLFPGVVLPLYIFEPRYRLLVQRLMEATGEDAHEFGMVGIRPGHVVRPDERTALYEIGCTAELRQVQSNSDGTFDIVSVGRRRFRLLDVDHHAEPYLVGTVEWVPDEPTEQGEATLLAAGVAELFHHYVRLLAGERAGADPDDEDDDDPSGSTGVRVPRLPDDPTVLSHLVAASAPLALDDRQELLATAGTVPRLRREMRLLKREATMLRRLRAVPVPLSELRVPMSPN